jgi:hypothetical protein
LRALFLLPRHHRAKAGRDNRFRQSITAHQVMIALTMRARIGMHGADNGKLISALGHVGH